LAGFPRSRAPEAAGREWTPRSLHFAVEKLILVEGLADQIHGRFDRAVLYKDLAMDTRLTLASERSDGLCCKNWK
jgi:hypothetical protein